MSNNSLLFGMIWVCLCLCFLGKPSEIGPDICRADTQVQTFFSRYHCFFVFMLVVLFTYLIILFFLHGGSDCSL
jgi:hypothetical protein